MSTDELLSHARRFEFDRLQKINGVMRVGSVAVEYRGDDKWAIVDGRLCYGHSRRWQWERSPSGRTDRFLRAYRWDLADAIDVCAWWERRAHSALASGKVVRLR